MSDLSQILTEVSTPEDHWNPKVKDSSSKIDGFMATYTYFKTKMGVAGLVFEPHPPNIEYLHNF